MKLSISILILLFCFFLVEAQSTFHISGYIFDSQSGEVLINAVVFEQNKNNSTYTNNYGYFNLKVNEGENTLEISYSGTKNKLNIDVRKDTIINISINTSIELKSVTVISDKQSLVNKLQPGMMNMSLKAVEKMPQLMGERDVLKTIQLMPGLNSASEGSTDMVAWGGNTDQNLVLLDGVPIYNPNHIFGFFSVFNDDAINSTKVYLGDIPARYNGRLSSVTDIRMREGNNQVFHCKGTAGTMSAKLLAEGPIIKNKSSFLVTGRISYLGLLAQPLMKHFTNFDGADYNFYDITAKFNHSLNANNKLFLSFYNGADYGESNKNLVFGATYEKTSFTTNATELNKTGWGNSATVLRWNHIFSGKAFSNLTLDYDNYFYNNQVQRVETYTVQGASDNSTTKYLYSIKSDSKIERKGMSYDLSFPFGDKHNINAGFHLAIFSLSPISQSDNDSLNIRNSLKKYRSIESTPYIEDRINLANSLELKLGLNHFLIIAGNKTYSTLLPRISSVLKISENLSINAAYIEMGQNIQLLSHNRISLSSDLWVPVTETIKPQYSKQMSAGFTLDLPFNLVFRSTGFYKNMYNLLAYKEGAVFDNSIGWAEQVTNGEGHSYGIDMMLERSSGRLSGWLSCTWSRSFRKFENLNNGNEFPFRYDRPIDIKTALMYNINSWIDASAIWVFSSGSVETVGNMAYVSNFDKGSPKYSNISSNITYGENITVYSYNALRIPAYHRMDISCNFHFNKPRVKSTLSIGAYNVYNHKNPYSVTLNRLWINRYYYSLDYQSLFGIIPYINYSFNF